MIEPKRPTGDSARARYMQWLHDQIKEMRPIAVSGMKMGTAQRGSYRIFEPQEQQDFPMWIRLSDNILHYLFDTYEIRDNVFDGQLGRFKITEVSSITRSGTTATVTTATAHGFLTGDFPSVYGADQHGYNIWRAEAAITVTSPTTFTYTVSGSPATPATGTITCSNGMLGTITPNYYSRNFRYFDPILDPPTDANEHHIFIDLRKSAGVWTLQIWKDEEDPFYVGTHSGFSPLGDYTGEDTNPVDPITITETVLWIVTPDDTFLAWVKTSHIFFSGLVDGKTYWRDFAVEEFATGSVNIGDYPDGTSFDHTEFGSGAGWSITKTVIGPPITPTTAIRWGINVRANTIVGHTGYSLLYYPDPDSPPAFSHSMLPYGTYKFWITGSDPGDLVLGSIPATLTISPVSDNAPG